MDSATALARIEGLEKFGINLGLDRIRACLRGLGDPQLTYPSVHVAGTNGKGSTSLLVASVLSEAGYRTGLYTSPPLETFGERIRVDGRSLPDAQVPDLLEDVLAIAQREPLARDMTQFEVITALAFLHFERARVDAAVVEVGLGGRLDSTNVLRPQVCVVTNIGLEHAEHLGGTLEAIAREKGGIFKPGVPAVTAASGEALGALEELARSVGTPLRAYGRDFEADAEGGRTFRFQGRRWRLEGLELGLLGSYQRANLAVALAALELLEEQGWTIGEEALRRALRGARWPGRMELAGPGPRVLLDGAHNPHASRALAQSLGTDVDYERLLLVLGILGDKDARSVLADLVPLAREVVLTRSRSARARDARELEEMVRGLSPVPVHSAPGVDEAVDLALAHAGPKDLVCVTGSLTTVGEARGHLRTLGWVR